jgi:hypothetical protein
MRRVRRAIIRLAFSTVAAVTVATSATRGQDLGAGGSLGGYGTTSWYSTPGMSGGGPMIIPYAGMFGGFMPGRMGGGSLSFRARSSTSMESARRPFVLSPMSGMQGGSRGGRAMGSFGSSGTMGSGRGTGLGGMRRMPGARGTSVMPPSIGYPFRQPPSLVSPSSAGMGMSM